MGKILLVEDEQELAVQIKDWLVSDGHLVEIALSGTEAGDYLAVNQYDLLILDRMLPGKSGMEICVTFRKKGGKTPILMLTARDSIEDRAEGLNAGADDYLCKPFHFVELSARVRAAIRRGATNPAVVYEHGEIKLNPETREVTKDGRVIHLEPREFNLLEFFLRHPNQIFSAEALLDRVWDTIATPDTVRTYVKALRHKLNDPGLISTVFGLGYKLESKSPTGPQ
ncbi:MAG: response regulator transcription factor [Candidatus Obscuribacterales bacterium]